MQRAITEFEKDEHGDWVAFLSCGHKQHVRHRPPFFERLWVTTEEGRRDKTGGPLDCIQCDRFEMPENFAPYRRTTEFNEETLPKSLRNDHSTKPGVWAKINVIEGKLIYRVDALDARFELSPGTPGIVIPQIEHKLEPIGAVRLFVEFYKRAAKGEE